jgi:hypothetical protein
VRQRKKKGGTTAGDKNGVRESSMGRGAGASGGAEGTSAATSRGVPSAWAAIDVRVGRPKGIVAFFI